MPFFQVGDNNSDFNCDNLVSVEAATAVAAARIYAREQWNMGQVPLDDAVTCIVAEDELGTNAKKFSVTREVTVEEEVELIGPFEVELDDDDEYNEEYEDDDDGVTLPP